VTKHATLTIILVVILVAILVAILASVDYTTGVMLDTVLFPRGQYWSIQTNAGYNVVTVTTYNPQVWYIGLGDCITVSYVDNE